MSEVDLALQDESSNLEIWTKRLPLPVCHIQDKMGRLVGYYDRTVRVPILHSTYFLPTGTRSFDRNHSLLDAAVAFNRTVVSNSAPVLTGWVVLRCGLATRQTPGGLKKSKESKSFRKKLTKHLLALRCQTQFTQAHDLGGIAMRYLNCPEGSFPWKIRQLLEHSSAAIDPAVAQTWHDLIGDSPPCFSREIHRAAFVILWMGLRGEREGLSSILATSFAEAAGVSGRQKWGLVLSSSARVSQVTYQTVVGVRYPELVTFNGTSWNFGKFVTHEIPRRGGFLPVFWDVPGADTHAVEDIGAVLDWLTDRCVFHADAKSSLAVLHNRNDMTNLFRADNWVSDSQDSIVFRGVTTCAGMTAHTVIFAQTRVDFLTGGRKKSFLALPEDKQTNGSTSGSVCSLQWLSPERALCLINGPGASGLYLSCNIRRACTEASVWTQR